MTNEGDYHQVINNRWQKIGNAPPDVNRFMVTYYWQLKPEHITDISNRVLYMDMTLEEKACVAFVQHSTPGRVSVTLNISVFAAPRNIRGSNSILKNVKFIKTFKIPTKYLAKLRAKCKTFSAARI